MRECKLLLVVSGCKCKSSCHNINFELVARWNKCSNVLGDYAEK
jgi:hypothetical protein